MQFTPKEVRIAERLRKRQRQWSRTRWIFLFNCILFTVLCVWCLIFEIKNFRQGSLLIQAGLAYVAEHSDQLPNHGIPSVTDYVKMTETHLVELILFTAAWLMLAFLTISRYVILIRDWTGNATQTMLLKLLEAQQEQKER